MRKKFNKLIKHPLISGSTTIVVGSLLANIINYASNLAVARLLIPSDYGIFAALLSIFNIFSVFSLTITTVFAKFTAVYIGQRKEEFIGPLIKKGSLWVGVMAFVICGMIIFFSKFIADFLNINNVQLIAITSAILFFSLLSSVPLGVLQGSLKFLNLSLVNIFSSFIKLVSSITLLLAGLRVFGAINAFLISSIAAFIIPFFAVLKYLGKPKESAFTMSNLYHRLSMYAFPVFLSGIGMTVIISIDIILVKHFFKAEIAGHYSALSLMGRSIFYVVQPIVFVLFPIIAQKNERKEKLFGTVLLSLILTGAPALVLSLIYFIYPEIILKIFFPSEEYAYLASYLGPFSIFVLFYVLAFLLNSFYISIGKIKVFFLTIAAGTIEIILITFFHESIQQVITWLIISSFLLLISLLLYYKHATKTA